MGVFGPSVAQPRSGTSPSLMAPDRALTGLGQRFAAEISAYHLASVSGLILRLPTVWLAPLGISAVKNKDTSRVLLTQKS